MAPLLFGSRRRFSSTAALRLCSRRLSAPKRVHRPGVLPGGQALRASSRLALRETQDDVGGHRRSVCMGAQREVSQVPLDLMPDDQVCALGMREEEKAARYGCEPATSPARR
jgi:hypothetical protein